MERNFLMNRWLGIGRLTRDPEVRYTERQMAVAKFTLAIDDGYGEKKKTNFINIIAFGKTAEVCEKHIGKGCRVSVEGKISTGSYEKDGAKVYTTDIIADRIEIIDFKAKDAQQQFSAPDGFEALDDMPF